MAHNKGKKNTQQSTVKKPASPGARPINRKGGGKPPSDTISNPVRIKGIQRKMLEAALQHLGDDEFGSMTLQLEFMIGLHKIECDLIEAHRKRVNDAFAFAVKMVPDSRKLSSDVLHAALPEIKTVSCKPAPQQRLVVVPLHRTRTIKPPQAEAHAPKPQNAKSLPIRRDTAAIARVADAARRRSA
jgi:hypothetical protein